MTGIALTKPLLLTETTRSVEELLFKELVLEFQQHVELMHLKFES